MTASVFFTVTVDTEADNAWEIPERLELKNIAEIPKFQDLSEKYSVIPTYLVSYECASRDEAITVLKPISDSGRCEIGHHLHVWSTPPFQEEGFPRIDTAWLHAYQSELPDSLFREKAHNLCEAIEKVYGKRPKSHRAGRWGIDERTINWLIENDFWVDTSVVPLADYSKNRGKKNGGPCFYSSPVRPFFCYGNIKNNDKNPIMEIPVTVDTPENLLKFFVYWMRYGFTAKRFSERLLRRLGGGRQFRPNPAYPDGVLSNIAEKAIRIKLPVLNFMLHSSDLALACSPYSGTDDKLKRVWKNLEDIFKLIKTLGVKPLTLSETAHALSKGVWIQKY